MGKSNIITVKGTEIRILEINEFDFISLTDMVKNFEDGLSLIEKWLRNKNTIEFIGIWEQIYNPDFNSLEFEGIKNEAGLNRFTLSAKKWIQKTNAIGIVAKTGRFHSGTFAHKDIAFEFGSWISPEFKLYLIKEFQRLKEEESKNLRIDWNLSRTLAKVNYHIHTDAIKENLIPPDLSRTKQNFIYANEADLLNMALFGRTAKEWRDANEDIEGNIRDYASLEQLIVLSNLESLNSVLIKQNLPAGDRLLILNKTAIEQMNVLVDKNIANKLLLNNKKVLS